MRGELGILNVGAGDTKLSFDPSNPKEAARAGKIVTDMIKRGYCILVQVGLDSDGDPIFKRAKRFDEATSEYIIADADDDSAAIMAPTTLKDENEQQAAKTPRGTRGKKGGSVVAIPAAKTRAVGVAHSAGG